MSVPEKSTAVTPPLTVARILRWIASVLFAILLAGYLICNRTFAKLGFPPFYVGELVLGFATLAALFDFHDVFIRPLKESWIMRCVAALFAYGLLRVLIDSRSHGLDAARDGVMCLYALAAFLSPWLFKELAQMGLRKKQRRVGITLSASSGFFGVILLSSPLALNLDWKIFTGKWVAPLDVKVDFLTLSAAVAFVSFVNLVPLVCYDRPDPFYPKSDMRNRTVAFGFISTIIAAISLFPLYLLLHLPTRAIKPAVFFPFVLPVILAFKASRTWVRMMLIAGLFFSLAGCASIYYVEGKAAREKIEALWDSNDSHFQTPEGQRAAHSEKWRLIFWKRCIGETIEKAPLFGLGFGTNLTDLLRDTPDWPIFADSQNAAKYGAPNRHPHSAHISVFARLGVAGLVLWLAILVGTLRAGVLRCLRASVSEFYIENTIFCTWLIFFLAMSFGVVLENPFGGIWFWALTGVIMQQNKTLSETRGTSQPAS